MISTLLVEHAAYVRGVLLGLAVVMVAVGAFLVRRDPEGRRVPLVLAGLACVPVLALTLSPGPLRGSTGDWCTVQLSVPFTGLDTLANLALLVPVAYFAALALRRPLAVGLVLLAASAAIEVLQALVPALGRACDTDDWWMNAVGTVLGVALALLTRAVATPRCRRTPRD